MADNISNRASSETHPLEADELARDYLDTASAQDCTGLIPAGIVRDEEVENYEELYPFLAKVTDEEGQL